MFIGLTIIVEYGDLHDAGPAQLDHPPLLLPLQGRQLHEELLVRLPLVIVHNCDANLKEYNQ
jgi:hypothetical protein